MSTRTTSTTAAWLLPICAAALAGLGCSSTDDGGTAGPTGAAAAPAAGGGGAGAGSTTGNGGGAGGPGGSGGLGTGDAGPDAGEGGGAGDAAADAEPPPDAAPVCPPPPKPAGLDVVFGPDFEKLYSAYELGPVPGAPPSVLGGCVIKYDDPNTLLVAVNSESPSGSISAVPLERDLCGHIVGFAGGGVSVAQTPYVDANLVYGPGNLLFYTEWPVNRMSQLPPGANAPARTTDLGPLGVGGGGPGGLGFVPPGRPRERGPNPVRPDQQVFAGIARTPFRRGYCSAQKANCSSPSSTRFLLRRSASGAPSRYGR
ncbi:MAG: hypothetical protein HY744_02625 [Deltaproteobacteria bacterium]|nr:hypothetical protein [Deltaproteobacteria bacterium]